MRDPAFTALQRPDGKWLLTKAGATMGVFDNTSDCETAIQRIILHDVRHYDADGKLIS